MVSPEAFFLRCIERFLFGDPTLPSPGKIDEKSPYEGTITFTNCPNGCPGLINVKNKPNCEVLVIPNGIKFTWNRKRYVIQEMGYFEIHFSIDGSVKIIQGEDKHDCYPRTFPDAIRQGHLRAIQILLKNEHEPTTDDVRQAEQLGHTEIADLLRAKREELDRLEGFLLVDEIT